MAIEPLYKSPAEGLVDAKTYRSRNESARQLASQVKGAFTKGNGEVVVWADLEKFGIPLNRITKTGNPWPTDQRHANIGTSFVLEYVLDNYFVPRFPYWGAEDLIKAEQDGQSAAKKRLRLTPESQCYKFSSGLTLFTEQDPVFRDIDRRHFPQDGSDPVHHIICPGGTGAGKTIIAAACLDQAIRVHNMHKPPPEMAFLPLLYPVQWVTVPNVEEQTKEELVRCGLGEFLGPYIQVYGYSSLAFSQGLGKFTEEIIIEPEEDPFASEEEIAEKKAEARKLIRWLELSAPRYIIVDECHKLANEDSGISRTFATLREVLNKMPWLGTRSLWLSATPFEKVADAKSFVTFAGVQYGGMGITPKNFNTHFAKEIALGSPTVVTAASMTRLFKAISKHVVEIPYFPWPCKSINSCELVDFRNEGERLYVQGAWDRHLDRCRALGKDEPQGEGAVYASFTIFRNEVEHVRIPQVVDRMHNAVMNEGRSAVCGTAFTGAVIKGVFTLIDEKGVDPNKIAVIWGGRKNIRPDRILNPQEMFDLIQNALESGNGLSPDEKRLIKRNLAWQQDAMIFGDGDDADRQDHRYARLQKLGLIGIQTREKRLKQIAMMQSGQADYCFFTMASGGTGLSLPHCDSRQRPRSGWYTPIYSGKEFTQAFGRLPRRNSISDSIQTVVLLNGTIESEHVAPILDGKLQAASAFTSKKNDLMTQLSKLFMQKKVEFEAKRTFGTAAVRTLEQAVKQAMEDEGTQVHFANTVDDDDDDE